jgi:hypothetical protein
MAISETPRRAISPSRWGPGGLPWLWLACTLACGAGRTRLSAQSGTARDPSAAGGSGNPLAGWDGGLLPSTPGVVRCGPAVCAPGEICCVHDEGSPEAIGCDPDGPDSCWGRDHVDVRVCDESADCAAGEVCCYSVWSAPPATLGGLCEKSLANCHLDGGDYLACGSEDDCRAVGTRSCVAQICRGEVLQTCGRLPSEWCPP